MASLISQLDNLQNFDTTSLQNDVKTRRKALKLFKSLAVQIESLMDTVLRIVWQEQTFATALRVCQNLKVVEILSKTNEFMSVSDIVKSTY
jgi:hypothetical protein